MRCTVLIREDPGTEPDHTVGLKLFALELRLDYMGTGVLMCRVSSLDVSLRDEWKMTSRKPSIDVFNPTRRYDIFSFNICCVLTMVRTFSPKKVQLKPSQWKCLWVLITHWVEENIPHTSIKYPQYILKFLFNTLAV